LFIIVEIIFFQILRKIEILKYVNEKHYSIIQQKLLKRNLEIEKHEKYLQVMNV